MIGGECTEARDPLKREQLLTAEGECSERDKKRRHWSIAAIG